MSPRQAQRSRMAPGAGVLAAAARAVSEVTDRGHSSDRALEGLRATADRAAIQAVTLGALRWYLRLLPAVASLLVGGTRGLTGAIRSLLIVGAHQIEYSRNAPQATVDAAVDASRALGQPRASGLVNAVLRRFVTDRGVVLPVVDGDPAQATAHPRWLVDELLRDWPDAASTILAANNAHPPLVLRVDLTRGSVSDYLGELAAAGISARPLPWAPAAVELERPVPVGSLPGFAEGRVSVQDAGAQLAAPLLDVRPGMRVLDACAAPGGKTVHLLEYSPRLAELVAVDSDSERIELLEQNLRRTGRRATVAREDVRKLEAPAFERILVDAPCSSTGVIRRHPDIKLLRRSGDIERYAASQLEILTAAFRLLAPQGKLLYATCSILPRENEAVLRQLLAMEPRARAAPMPAAAELAPGARDRGLGIQLLPGGEAGTDGFYYACLEKTTAGN